MRSTWILGLIVLIGCTELSPAKSGKDSGASPDGADSGSGSGSGGSGSDGDGSGGSGSTANCTAITFYKDADQDGFGVEADTMSACEMPSGYSMRAGDCDDDCATCFVGSAESCDGHDNDCDQAVDEKLETPCGSMDGACKEGTQTCKDGKSECEGGIDPTTEACEGEVDEDCDGTVDEGCPCEAGSDRACGPDTGECKAGEQACEAGVWAQCKGAVGPKREACDNKDNDCDEKTDEDVSQDCGSDVGDCKSGTQDCADGEWGDCKGSSEDAIEICDGHDNDCDGTTDEMLTRPCATEKAGMGVCLAGTQACVDAAWDTACPGAVLPGTEVCDALDLDEDCDGTGNDGCDCTPGEMDDCGTDVGECEFGKKTCQTGGTWGTACTGGKTAGTETCNNLDDDCDGKTDEALTRSCGTSMNAPCHLGTETCSAGSWTCIGAVNPGAAEICDQNMVDDDCDGSKNEGCDCYNGQTRNCGTNVGRCDYGTETCSNGKWPAAGTACIGGRAPETETCDGQDEDCDNVLDQDENSICSGNLKCVDGNCECTKHSDCGTGQTCDTNHECKTAWTRCQNPAATCPAGSVCSNSGQMCMPQCDSAGACPVKPSGSSTNISTLCNTLATPSYCVLVCPSASGGSKGGCPGNTSCITSLPTFCGYL